MSALDELTLRKVNDFVDDDLLSCFLWAAGENAVAQPGWESPSVNPLAGIPLPPTMLPLPAAAPAVGRNQAPASTSASPSKPTRGSAKNSGGAVGDGESLLPALNTSFRSSTAKVAAGAGDKGLADFDEIGDLGDSDIEDISKMGVPQTKEQKLMQRMQRKAESARVARLRKKDYVTGLEEQIKELRAQLQAQEQRGAAAGAHQEAKVKPDLEGGSGLAHLEVHGTVEQYVSTKRKQQETLEEYLECIEDILCPVAPLTVAFTPHEGAVEGEEPAKRRKLAEAAALSTDTPVSALRMRDLTTELGFTPEQVDGLVKLQEEYVRPDKERVADCMNVLRQLRSKMREHMEASQHMTDMMRRILEPSQVPKYLEWIERHHRSLGIYNALMEDE